MSGSAFDYLSYPVSKMHGEEMKRNALIYVYHFKLLPIDILPCIQRDGDGREPFKTLTLRSYSKSNPEVTRQAKASVRKKLHTLEDCTLKFRTKIFHCCNFFVHGFFSTFFGGIP